ncbi:MAG: hypothetical protein U0Z17_05010 [Bacteroidales bacterium]
MKLKTNYLVLALLLLSSAGLAQNKVKVGLSGSLQGSQYGISVPCWAGPKTVIAPFIDFRYGESIGTDFSVGMETRFYLKTEKIRPYYGFKLGAAFNIPSSENTINDNTTIDGVAGIAFGGEYFISENFSVGIEAQGNLTKSAEDSDRYGNPGGINFNTATRVSATIYF